MKLLVEACANINIQSGSLKWTPVMEAAYKGYIDIVRYLMSQGADTRVKNSKGETALDLAKSQQKSEIMEILSGAHCPIVATVEGFKFKEVSAIGVAVLKNSSENLKSFLQFGCDVNYNGTFFYQEIACKKTLGINSFFRIVFLSLLQFYRNTLQRASSSQGVYSFKHGY